MANGDITLLDLPEVTSVSNEDLLLVVTSPTTNPNTVTIPFGDLVGEVQAAVFVANTPANSSALTVSAGQAFYDAGYLYVAVANNLVKRVALSTF